MGFTNSVQPYCRFAIIAMQTMPMNSCIQRYDAGRVAILFNVPALASVDIGSSKQDCRHSRACPVRHRCDADVVVRTSVAGGDTRLTWPLAIVEVFYLWHKLLVMDHRMAIDR